MKRLLEFARAMRANGFRYRRHRRGFGHFVLYRDIGGRRAYAAELVMAQTIVDSLVPISDIVAWFTEAANHRLDQLVSA